ncbi:MAG: hypothetical protein DCF15_10520 [Phormidesmis priestleyi]|uniref:Cryptochrome/DNA photolyase FAD-binding domain-containing protein n=1 Tax=Phormidesmis priestleyi TaxID=268141 RepID=A0A2W4ZKM6_9CYAN|nr:MAG: hypothetical protein DCF15_10520 [Phormidesmis priestleyi]
MCRSWRCDRATSLYEDNRFENNHFENNRFENNGWDFNLVHYEAWKTGHTGFPIVDAAARCLLATGGWLALNFRVRAIYASFLSNLARVFTELLSAN